MELQRINDTWKCKYPTPGWPELAEAEIRFKTPNESEPTTEQFKVIAQLVERAEKIREQVHQALDAYTRAYWVDEMGVDEETADSIESIGGYYGPLNSIFIWQSRSGATHIGFEFESLLDENEHGVGVLWANNRVVSVGSAEIIQPLVAENDLKNEFLKRLQIAFPDFAAKLGDGSKFSLDNVQPPASEADLRNLEQSLGLLLPESYKALLRCAREFWLGGGVQFGHSFVHDFEPFDTLTTQQQRSIQHAGVSWPPPSQGMLCFAEFFMEADGDQVLFDVSSGLVEGEYPVMYYAHESSPPSVRQLTATFPEFLASILSYPS